MSTYTPNIANEVDTQSAWRALENCTPAYLFDPSVVLEDYAALKQELGTPLIVSLKANPSVDLLNRCVHAFVDGIEVASMGELSRITGRTKAPKYANTPAMDDEFLRAALAARATIIVDSIQQARAIVGSGARSINPVMLRVNAAAISSQLSGDPDQFGMDSEELTNVVRLLQNAGLAVAGVHVFAGSRKFVQRYRTIAEEVAQLVTAIERDTGVRIGIVNMGGGFPEDFRTMPQEFAQYRESLIPLQKRLTVVHESGRAIFARCGSFVTRVAAVKRVAGRSIAVCDGGMAHCFMLAQTEQVIKRWRTPRVIHARGMRPTGEATVTELYGNTCNRADRIGQVADVTLEVGDLCVFDNCGAYHHTYTVGDFLSLSKARVFIQNGALEWN